MASIRIEFVPIKKFGIGWFGFDHLQLVYQQDELTLGPHAQDNWYVLEGVSFPTDAGSILAVEGDTGNLTLSAANNDLTGDDLIATLGTPESRGSLILPISFDTIGAWIKMAEYGHEINLNEYPYRVYGAPGTPYPTINSSSVVASLVWQIGLDVNFHLPRGLRFSPGTSTYLGTSHDDVLSLPTSSFDTLFGGIGNDDLSGSNDPSRVDKLFGGPGDDIFHWSTGFNIINGGDPSLAKDDGGYDRVDYSGAGTITIKANKSRIAGLSPDYIVSFTGAANGGGLDWLYSIESVRIDSLSDTIIWGDNVTGIPEDLAIDLGADNSKQGDLLDFSKSDTALTIIADSSEEVRVRAGSEGSSKSWWVTSAEWIIGSAKADEIHLDAKMRGADGGNGDDLIDARAVIPGSGASPQGFDSEISGGNGDDTLISGGGRTLARGGEGSDKFILGALSDAGQNTEFVIDDAGAEDRLLVPLNFFNGTIGSSDNSILMPLLGGAANWSDVTDTNAAQFVFQTQQQLLTSDDQTQGIITFVGEILYFREGSDLVIHLIPGRTASRLVDSDPNDEYTLTYARLDFSRETIIRVRNFQPGQLGMTFVALNSNDAPVTDKHGNVVNDYTNLDTVAQTLTHGGNFTDSLAPVPTTQGRPDPKSSMTNPPINITGSSDNDVIDTTTASSATTLNAPALTASSNTIIDAGAGNDTVTTGSGADTVRGGSGNDTITTGAGDDILIGGTGADTLAGGTGDDTYYVDNPGDVVIERAGEGHDKVFAAIDYTLPGNVEDLTLTGTAVRGTGNSADNTIEGNDLHNVLDGGDGNDTLYGGNGDDTLIGGNGSDTYVYKAGSGHKTIIDTGASTNDDVLVLTNGIKPSGIQAYRLSSSPNDLILRFADGGWVRLQNQLGGDGIEHVTFDDNTVWTRADLAALRAPLLDYTPPDAQDDATIAIFVQSGTIPSDAFLGNDTSNFGPLRIVSIANVSTGTATVNSNGDVVVSTPTGFNGDVTFTYTAIDIHGETATANATVTVAPPPNHDPVANTDTIASAFRNTAITIKPSDLTANDTDADGNPLTLTGVSNPTHGTVQQGADGRIVFTPDADYVGAASFSYAISDGQGGTATGTVNLTIIAPPGVTKTGTSGNDVLNGGAGDDTLMGLAGNDLLVGGLGADTLIGGDGNDIYYVDNVGDRVIETNADQATGGFDVVHASVNYTLTDNVEMLFVEGAATTGTGNAGNNTLYGEGSSQILTLDGGAGNDTLIGSFVGFNTLIGGDGNDTLISHNGNNTLTGGNGNDIYYVTAATDKVIETNADQATGGFDVVHASVNYTLTDNVEMLFVEGAATTGTGNAGNNTLYGEGSSQILTLDGGAGNDTLIGSFVGFNTLIGGDGNDTLISHNGHNTLIGGSGNDTYYAESATDIILETDANLATGGTDRLWASYDGAVLGANIEQLILSGNAFTGTGNGLDNYITAKTTHGVTLDGGAGNDFITGTAYDDILTGGTGNDQIDLGAGGHDTIRYTLAGFGQDRVYGFDPNSAAGRDMIDVSGRGFTTASLGSGIKIAASGVDTLITIGADSIRLVGVTNTLLSSANFKF